MMKRNLFSITLAIIFLSQSMYFSSLGFSAPLNQMSSPPAVWTPSPTFNMNSCKTGLPFYAYKRGKTSALSEINSRKKQATKDALAKGKIDGIAAASALSAEDGQKAGYDKGYKLGNTNKNYKIAYNKQYKISYKSAFNIAKKQNENDPNAAVQGQVDGEKKGNAEGLREGQLQAYQNGYTSGYNYGLATGPYYQGYSDGYYAGRDYSSYEDGESDGAYAGKMDGYDAGYDYGYSVGYQDGYYDYCPSGTSSSKVSQRQISEDQENTNFITSLLGHQLNSEINNYDEIVIQARKVKRKVVSSKIYLQRLMRKAPIKMKNPKKPRVSPVKGSKMTDDVISDIAIENLFTTEASQQSQELDQTNIQQEVTPINNPKSAFKNLQCSDLPVNLPEPSTSSNEYEISVYCMKINCSKNYNDPYSDVYDKVYNKTFNSFLKKYTSKNSVYLTAYKAGKKQGLAEGKDAAMKKGYLDGSEVGSKNGTLAGVKAGKNKAYTESYLIAYRKAYDHSYQLGLSDTDYFNSGYYVGLPVGQDETYHIGYNDGYLMAGYDNNDAYSAGYEDEYYRQYDDYYNQGYNSGYYRGYDVAKYDTCGY